MSSNEPGMSGSIGDLITLGAVQFGLDYGITNRSGVPSDEELRSILQTALAGRVTRLDTARSYGNSEERLGKLLPALGEGAWRITTKIPQLGGMRDVEDSPGFADSAVANLDRSLAALQRDSVDLLLLHASEDMWRSGVIERLEKERDRGRFREFGVSVYDPDEAAECLKDSRVEHLQIPLSLLDHRWFGAPFEPAIARRSDVTIHVRSAFLQGLLLHGPEFWPVWVRHANEIDDILMDASRRLEGGRIELCLRFLTSLPWVGRVIVGVHSSLQLREILAIRNLDPLPAELRKKVDRAAGLAPERLLIPSRW